MSFVIAVPEALATAASDLAGIGSTLEAAHAAAAPPTTGVLAAAEDEVSAQIAALFSAHGQGFQRLSAQAAAFHSRLVQTLTAGADQYAAAEASAARTLTNAGNTVQASAGKVLEQIGGASAAASTGGGGGLLSGIGNSLFGGGSAPRLGLADALSLRPTGGLSALTGLSPLLRSVGLTNAAVAAPAAFEGIATAIENAYNFIEPYVQWGFSVAAWAVGWLPWIGILGPQINIFYALFEPMVQSGLFNILDWITGSISFGTGLSNFIAASAASINQFIQNEINWFLGFLPPLPPFPPLP